MKWSRAPGRRRACAIAVAAAMVVAVSAGAVVAAERPAMAGVRQTTTDTCATFGALRDAFDAIGEMPTKAEAFAVIDKATRAFRKAAAHAPAEIADDMRALAASLDQLDRKLKPLRGKLHKTRSATKYEAMVDPIQQAFEEWTKDQDAEALGAAQTRVQTWASEHCGIELGST